MVEEKRNEEALREQMKNDGRTEKEIRELAERRREQLRNDLKNQIKEKRSIQEQQRRDLEAIPNSGLPIGFEYVNRFDRYKNAHQAALKEQIGEKEKKKIEERELDKQLQSQYVQEMRDYQEAERMKRDNAELARKEHYRQEMSRFQDERNEKKRQEDLERLRDLEVEELNRLKARQDDVAKLTAEKQREAAHITALKDQAEAARERKRQEDLERKNYQVGILKPEAICKLYDCLECHKKYPPARLNKVKQAYIPDDHKSELYA